MELEKELFGKVFDLGKLFILLFLGMREAHWRLTHTPNTNGQWQGPKDRVVGTLFGKVRYRRTYVYRSGSSVYPLDIELGLPLDGFSMLVRSYAAHIATKMSYAQSAAVLSLFLKWSPSQGTIEERVLGLGRHTQQWFASAPAPEEDGEVLVIQLDRRPPMKN